VLARGGPAARGRRAVGEPGRARRRGRAGAAVEVAVRAVVEPAARCGGGGCRRGRASVARGLGLGAVGAQVGLDAGALLAAALALCDALLLEALLELAVERGALGVVGADAEGAAHALVLGLLGGGELVTLVRLDARGGGGGSSGGEEALAKSVDLLVDLVGLDAVVLERDLELEALGLDLALALVVEDALVRGAVGERALEVGGGLALILAGADPVVKW